MVVVNFENKKEIFNRLTSSTRTSKRNGSFFALTDHQSDPSLITFTRLHHQSGALRACRMARAIVIFANFLVAPAPHNRPARSRARFGNALSRLRAGCPGRSFLRVFLLSLLRLRIPPGAGASQALSRGALTS